MTTPKQERERRAMAEREEQVRRVEADAMAGRMNPDVAEIAPPVSTDDPNPPVAADAKAPAPVAGDAADTADEPKAPVRGSPGDDARAAIAKRFRRNTTPLEDINDPAVMHGRLDTPAVTPPQAQAQAAGEEDTADTAETDGKTAPGTPATAETKEGDQPRRYKITVRRQEREVDENELLRLAQIAAASESYLEEAKRLRDEAAALHGAAKRQDPASAPAATSEADRQPGTESETDDLDSLVDAIQFGTREEAKEALKKLRSEAATPAIDPEAIFVNGLMRQDVIATKRLFDDFRTKNAAIYEDPIALRTLEAITFDEIRTDLRNLGVPDERMPNEPKDLANWHRFYRVQGYPIRPVEKVLADAKDRLDKWRGGQAAPASTPPAAQRPGQPRVAVDRTARRETIPVQPSRSSAPALNANPSTPATREQRRSSVVENMRRARGQTVMAS